MDEVVIDCASWRITFTPGRDLVVLTSQVSGLEFHYTTREFARLLEQVVSPWEFCDHVEPGRVVGAAQGAQ